MVTNLLDSMKELITPELTGAAASRMGESEGAVARGFVAALPLVLAGLLQKTNDHDAMSQIMSLLTSRANSPDVLGNPKGLLSADPSSSAQAELGGSLLTSLFGRDLGAATTAISEQAGMKRNSASSILTLVATLLAAWLGSRMRTEGLTLSGLIGMLSSQRDGILRALPGALAGIGGLGALRASTAGATTGREDERRGAGNWLWAAAALFVLLAGGWAMWGSRSAPDMRAPASETMRQADQVARSGAQAAGDAAQQAGQAVSGAAQQAGQAANAAVDHGQLAAANLGAFLSRRLPSNVDLNVPEHGVETQIIAYLDDPSRPADPVVWFNFDRLLFGTGSATLKPASQEQIKNVAEILQAYPTVKLKIGGYTDNVGDPGSNLALSRDRAANVVAAIVAFGIAPERLAAEGYGEQHPIADNSNEGGRAQNRRIAMRVVEK